MNGILSRMGMIASVALLSACGGGNSEPAAEQETTAASTEAATAPAPAPVEAAPGPDETDTLDGTTLASMTADATHGGQVFIQCKSCHALEAGVNKIGPSLAGVVGRTAGTVEGYTYSDANKNSGITWTKEKLYQYLEKPQRVVPGTKMAFAGLPKGQDRADVIAYLETGGQ
ncbi:c-type cytochrome [Qipengyuania sp.]|uniref:c-type cytochrome n=1 Tax=Qipengyuania sp. TaxID=2004515 RepID=UPI003AF697AA